MRPGRSTSPSHTTWHGYSRRWIICPMGAPLGSLHMFGTAALEPRIGTGRSGRCRRLLRASGRIRRRGQGTLGQLGGRGIRARQDRAACSSIRIGFIRSTMSARIFGARTVECATSAARQSCAGSCRSGLLTGSSICGGTADVVLTSCTSPSSDVGELRALARARSRPARVSCRTCVSCWTRPRRRRSAAPRRWTRWSHCRPVQAAFCWFAGNSSRSLLIWREQDACDGFNLLPAVLPNDLDMLVDAVVPRPQRAYFSSDYTGKTLREHFGLARPRSQYATQAVARRS